MFTIIDVTNQNAVLDVAKDLGCEPRFRKITLEGNIYIEVRSYSDAFISIIDDLYSSEKYKEDLIKYKIKKENEGLSISKYYQSSDESNKRSNISEYTFQTPLSDRERIISTKYANYTDREPIWNYVEGYDEDVYLKIEIDSTLYLIPKHDIEYKMCRHNLVFDQVSGYDYFNNVLRKCQFEYNAFTGEINYYISPEGKDIKVELAIDDQNNAKLMYYCIDCDYQFECPDHGNCNNKNLCDIRKASLHAIK